MNELAILIIAFGVFLNQGQNLENLDFESLPDYHSKTKNNTNNAFVNIDAAKASFTILNKNGIWFFERLDKGLNPATLNTDQQTTNKYKANNATANGFIRLPDGSLLQKGL